MTTILKSDFRNGHSKRREQPEEKKQPVVSETTVVAIHVLGSFPVSQKNALTRAAMRWKATESSQKIAKVAPQISNASKDDEEIDPASIPSKKERNKERREKVAQRTKQIDKERSQKYCQDDESLPLERAFADLDPIEKKKEDKPSAPSVKAQPTTEEWMEGSYIQKLLSKEQTAPIPIIYSYPSDSDDEGNFDPYDAMALSFLRKQDA